MFLTDSTGQIKWKRVIPVFLEIKTTLLPLKEGMVVYVNFPSSLSQ